MKPARCSLFANDPMAEFKVRKEPFGLRYRSPALSPFGLSSSKPSAYGTTAPFDRLRTVGKTSSAWPFDNLRANGRGKPPVANSRNGPKGNT